MAINFMKASELAEREPTFNWEEPFIPMQTTQYFPVRERLPELIDLWAECAKLSGPQWGSFEFVPQAFSGTSATARGLWVDGVSLVLVTKLDSNHPPAVYSSLRGQDAKIGKRVDPGAVEKAIEHLRPLAFSLREAAALDASSAPGSKNSPAIRM